MIIKIYNKCVNILVYLSVSNIPDSLTYNTRMFQWFLRNKLQSKIRLSLELFMESFWYKSLKLMRYRVSMTKTSTCLALQVVVRCNSSLLHLLQHKFTQNCLFKKFFINIFNRTMLHTNHLRTNVSLTFNPFINWHGQYVYIWNLYYLSIENKSKRFIKRQFGLITECNEKIVIIYLLLSHRINK